jgi:lipoprotein-anchoring transpeptidase ErfK/SrfK
MKYLIVSALALSLFVGKAHAQNLQFAANTFKVIGGMENDAAPAFEPQRRGFKSKKFRRKSQYAAATLYAPRAKTSLAIETVAFHRNLEPGSIVVNTGERKLYLVLPGGQARMYPVGVGKEGFEWSGTNRITRKAVWPDWRPPEVMIKREAVKGHFIPAHMPGGPKNPLGARAMYIGSTQYRIHGTTQPWSIGRAMSSGCIRMMNEHVIDLYENVKVGAKVIVE